MEKNGCGSSDIAGNIHFIHAPLQALSGHRSVVSAADWLSSGCHVVTGSWDGMALVFDSETGDKLDTLLGWL